MTKKARNTTAVDRRHIKVKERVGLVAIIFDHAHPKFL